MSDTDRRPAYALRAVPKGYIIVHVLNPTEAVEFAPGTYATVFAAIGAAARAGYNIVTPGTEDSCTPTVPLVV